MKTLKITNPRWLVQYGDVFTKYEQRINVDGIEYESLMAYFYNAVQFGGDMAELWMVFDDNNKPCAFALFKAMLAPYVGTVMCEHVHRWRRSETAIDLLVDEFVEFGKRHRATVYTGAVVNEKAFSILKKRMEKKMDVSRTEVVKFTATRKE